MRTSILCASCTPDFFGRPDLQNHQSDLRPISRLFVKSRGRPAGCQRAVHELWALAQGTGALQVSLLNHHIESTFINHHIESICRRSMIFVVRNPLILRADREDPMRHVRNLNAESAAAFLSPFMIYLIRVQKWRESSRHLLGTWQVRENFEVSSSGREDARTHSLLPRGSKLFPDRRVQIQPFLREWSVFSASSGTCRLMSIDCLRAPTTIRG